MRKKTKITEEDISAFHKAVEGVKPLLQKKTRLSPNDRHKPVQKARHSPPTPYEPFHFSESDYIDPVHSEELITYKCNGISNKTLRKLRKGQYNIEAKLDLHGMSTEEARTAINHFLQHCLHERMRVVLIIHGKGHHSQTPILKNKVNHWLRETHVVLAFCSAAPQHGSRGALYVLLKNTTEENFA